MAQKERFKFIDSTRVAGKTETQTVSFETVTVNAANFDDQEIEHNALSAAIVALSLGILVESDFAGFTTFHASESTPPVDPNAQRERILRILGEETVSPFRAWSRQIPVADATNVLPDERLDPTHVTYTDLKAAIEAHVLSNGNTIVVTDVILTGRNL